MSNAAVRLRGKSSWVDTVMFDPNPEMQFDIAFDQIDASQKFHGVSTLHLEIARDDWTLLNTEVPTTTTPGYPGQPPAASTPDGGTIGAD